MLPENLKDRATYEIWFQAEIDKALKSPPSERSYEQLKAHYKAKYA